jgi:hypothetical protein
MYRDSLSARNHKKQEWLFGGEREIITNVGVFLLCTFVCFIAFKKTKNI